MLMLQPILQGDRLLGVIELGALRPFPSGHQTVLAEFLPVIAMNLEIQHHQEHLKRTERWYRGIIESAPNGMLVADAEGVIMLTNTMLDTMFAYQPGELLGHAVEELIPDSMRTRHRELRAGFMESDKPREMGQGRILTGIRKNGSEFRVEVGLSLLAAHDGRGRCVCASVLDISASDMA
jgi:PAS domain S-box-containing protein